MKTSPGSPLEVIKPEFSLSTADALVRKSIVL
jgi:hypothetical protein